ncbi:MAG TPA: carboxypeptidase regulatory-like domain-containing protein [Acidobacteriaceae bacterium]|jgi:hypothetical protein
MYRLFIPHTLPVVSSVLVRKAPRTLALAVIFLSGLFLSWGATAFAQAIYGTISGKVTDASGAIVPNATVTVTDLAKGTTKTAQSNSDGLYTVDELIPDNYSVKAEAANFTPAEAKSVAVSADTTQTVNLAMNVGGTTQTVTVTAGAAALKTDRADVAQIISGQSIQSLPNIDRNFTQFELLTPGVQRSSFNTAPTENPQASQAVEINGSNYGTTGWELDGTDNRDPVLGIIVINPTLDSISEMKVTSQNYPAEFGGAVGGVITAQTRSGSNNIHGDAFEFRRSDAQEARDPFTQFAPDPVTNRYIPSSLYNQFGGSVGGPIKKDRAFFFLDYQGTRQRVGTSLRENVPTSLVRSTCLSGTGNCNLSEYTTAPLYNPVTKQIYTGGIIPASALSPQAIKLLSALPAPNSGSGITNNYVASGNGRNDGDQADVRLDWQTTPAIHSFARYDYANFRLFGTPVFGAAGGTGFGLGNSTGNDNVQNQSVAAGFDWAIHPNLLTDLRFGFLAYHVAENKYDAGTTPALAAGIPNANIGAFGTDGSPTFNITGDSSVSPFGEQGCNCPLLESEQVFQLANNWTKIVGNHTFMFGGDIRYAMNLRNASDFNRTGQFTFGSGSTAVPGNATSSGLALASALLGAVEQYQRFVVYDQSASNRQKRGAFYAQDTWRATPKLTLDYGVRWDLIFPETANSAGTGGFTYPYLGYTQVAGIGAGTNGGQEMDYLNLAGRFGFAYQIRSGTVLRGGVGQVYDDVGFFGTLFGSVLAHNTPVLTSQNITTNNSPGQYAVTLATAPGVPAAPFIPANGRIPMQNGVSYEFRPNRVQLPKVDQYNLSLQQQITSNMTATLAYVGNIGERVYPGETYGYDVNEPALPATPAQLAAGSTSRRPFYQRYNQIYNGALVQCCDSTLTSTDPASRSNYNALQATVEQRFHNGFQLTGNYTWSKALFYGNDAAFTQYRAFSYGPSDTNRANTFVASGTYQLPFGKNKRYLSSGNRLMNYAVGGWTLNGTTTWQSGLPFTPTYDECSADQDLDTNVGQTAAESDCRPDKIQSGAASGFSSGVSSYDPTTHTRRLFTPVAPLATNGAVSGPFARPAFGTFGNIGLNSLRGPSEYFADASLFKDFPITERVQAQFQFQAFNVFNHAPLGFASGSSPHCIDCSPTTTNAGQITALDPAVTGTGLPAMRQLQFAAKFTF